MTERKRLPTDAELAILTILWSRGGSTVREVHDALADGTGYTTVLKLLQIMHQKGLVKRDESERTHVYRAAVAADRTQTQLVRDLADRAFAGSASQLVMRALSSQRTPPDELAAIRALLDAAEKKGKRS